MRVLQIFVVAIIALGVANAAINFKNGRRRGGNVVLGDDLVKINNIFLDWFTQQLDHFQPTDERTWYQKYYVNDEFWNKSDTSPVFISIDGEGPSSFTSLQRGAWYASAKKFGALMFQLEHRFYGESQPTRDLSTKNLKYLSSQQALQDVATFITAMKTEYNLTDTNRWIAFGGSYAGSLAAWARLQFPHLVHGAMSGSGPLLAKADFWEYFQVVQDSLRTHSDECVDTVKEAFQTAESLAKSAEGRLELDALFLLCEPLESLIQQNEKNIPNLMGSFADNFAGVVQYNNIIPNDTTINDVCSIMVDKEYGEPIARLAALNTAMQLPPGETCLDYNYDEMIQEMQAKSWDSEVAEGMRQWIYQTCTEFGWYQTTSQDNQVFGTSFPIDFWTDQCADIYGPDFDAAFIDRATDNTNTVYGALDIQESNVVYVHGTIDPWHAVGLYETRRKDAPAILIEGTAHCANMGTERDDDLPQLKQARVQVDDLIDSWLRQ